MWKIIKKSIYEVLFAASILIFLTILILGIIYIDSLSNKSDDNISINTTDKSVNILNSSTDKISTVNMSLNSKNLTLTNNLDKNLSSNISTLPSKSSSSNWCELNTNKVINNKKYTILGLTSLQGKIVCKAIIQTSNSETVRYWNEDETIVSESSSSHSSDGSYAEASSNISIPN